ncbi:MAG TPA: ABC transporter permease [Chloroflexia bacterium]|nr:ABC transporter permease [Chloroflexia bacterium]
MAESIVMHDAIAEARPAGRAAYIWRRFRRHKAGMAGLIVLILLVLACIIIPMLSPFDLYEANPVQFRAPAGTVNMFNGEVYYMGTDNLGRDIMKRLFIAGRVSISVALLSTTLMVILGTVLGAVAGYYGGLVDTILMRVTDFLLAMPLIPMFLFVLRLVREAPALRPLWREQGTDTFLTVATIAGVFVLLGWMGMARLVRGQVLSLRSLQFVEASRALGVSSRRIIFRHLLPNTAAPILVAATFAVGDFIILESVLAFFNQGINDPPLPSLGNMLTTGQGFALYVTNLNPFEDIRGYMFLLPGFMVFATVLSINYIGDALRSALDPHER